MQTPPDTLTPRAPLLTGGPRALLRLEGLLVLAASALAYRELGGDWTLFALLFLVPDLSLLGYLGGARVGAAVYNAGHSYLGPASLVGLGVLAGALPIATLGALIWTAHIGFDRAASYGLKYASGFRDTHLGRVGRDRSIAATPPRSEASVAGGAQ